MEEGLGYCWGKGGEGREGEGREGGVKDGERGEGRGRVVRSAGQGIGLSIASRAAIDDGVVIGGQSSRPSGMAPRGSPGSREVLEVLVIRVDTDGVGSPLQVDPPLFEGLDNR